MRKALITAVLTFLTVCILAPVAYAAEGGNSATAYMGFAAALALGLAAAIGALAQGRATAAALEGIARNPGAADKIFTPMILGLALIESLVIYVLLIAFIYNPA